MLLHQMSGRHHVPRASRKSTNVISRARSKYLTSLDHCILDHKKTATALRCVKTCTSHFVQVSFWGTESVQRGNTHIVHEAHIARET